MISFGLKITTVAFDMRALQQLWQYREFVFGTVTREFKLKYQRSILGAFWVIANPLAMITVYTVIFSQIMRAKLPGVDSAFAYSIFLCAGVTIWTLFSEILSRAQNLFIDNANLIKKLNFPKLCLPVAAVLSACINFAIIFCLFLVFLLVTGNWPGRHLLAVVPLLIVLTSFAIGLGLIVGVLNVFFRDVGHFFGIFVNFWFWGTPIVYSINILPPALQPYAQLNPMTGVITGFQEIFVNNTWPNWLAIWPAAVEAAVLCFIAAWLFKRRVGEMVDEL